MSNLFANIPAPVGNGSGAAVDVSTFGYYKTVSVAGSFVATVTIEISNEAIPTQWAPLVVFGNADGANLGVAARWMRVAVTGYVRGVPTCDVGATDEGASFAALPATVGNGAGAAVDVSSLPVLKTLTVGGPFRGYVQVEVSEDGLTRWSQVGFGFSNPGSESQQIVARYMRVVRSGVPQIDPGLPIVNVGACVISAGVGGSTIIVEDEGVPVVGGPFTTLDFVGEGVVASDGGGGTATVTIPRTVAVDGVTITGDGSTGNPLVAVAPVDTGITELTQDVLAGPGSGSQVATVVGLQSNPVAAGLPVAGDLLTWDGVQWAPSAAPGGLTPTTHETLRQLIHFLDDGPGAGFLSGAVKLTGYNGALVTSEVWYEDGTLTTRYVDLAVTYVGALPSVEVWRIYASDGVTITATLTDVIAYAGALETQRTRTWI